MTKKATNAYHPDTVSPPGETLQELLEHQGMSQAELAERTGRPKKTINEIVKGKAAITPETALQLEKVLGVPARFWMSRESAYQEWVARTAEATDLENDSRWIEKFPVAEMVRRRWIAASNSAVGTMREMLRFFGVARPSLANKRSASFRRSDAFEINEAATQVWLQQAINVAREVETSPYDSMLFRRELDSMRRLSRKHISPVVPEVVSRCASAGVAVVSVEELPGTRISGATMWANGTKAVIALTFRNRTDDHLWFAFFHEAGHVLLHPRGGAFVERKVDKKARDEGQRDGSGTIDQEEEANAFARDSLIPARPFEEFVGRGDYSIPAIERFAREIEIAPGIVVGRLQRDGELEWGVRQNTLKRSREAFH